jgi:YidC/Oxa1 family membrane protein insertase
LEGFVEIWNFWIESIRNLLELLSSGVGLGAGFGIVALTLLFRTALLPVSWSGAYRGCIRQKKLNRLQGELQRIKERFAGDPRRAAESTLALYRANGLSPIDGRGLLGGLAQLPVFLGVFQALRDGISGGRFLWAPNLSRPDFWLAILVGVSTALMMSLNPDLPESVRWLMIAIPSAIALIAALKFCSALAVYWTASNCFSALQTLAVHRVVAARIKSGALSI